MNHKIMIPELRFQEFDGEWKNRSMRDFTKINQGLQSPISERFYEKTDDNYFYITNEFLRKGSEKSYFIKNPSESVICYEDDILMTRTGNTGQVVTGVHGAFHNNFFKIKYDKTCSKWFLYYFLTSHKAQHTILKLAGTSTIPDLNHADFYKITLNTPTFPEQQKIASFLSAVDEKIQQISRKKELLEQYKKGLMQQLFSGKLRFKDENGNDYADWEDTFFADTGKILIGLTHTPEYQPMGRPFLSSKNISGAFIDYNNIQYISEEKFQSMPESTKPKKGDILFTRVGSNLGNPKVIEEDIEFGIFVSLGVFRVNEKASNYFMRIWMDSDYFWRQLEQKVAGGAKNNLNTGWLKEFKLNLPSFPEQQKIANFLSSIDAKIESTSQQITQTQSFKKGLLQQLFV
jgi:type I restriction enzyme S subunit